MEITLDNGVRPGPTNSHYLVLFIQHNQQEATKNYNEIDSCKLLYSMCPQVIPSQITYQFDQFSSPNWERIVLRPISINIRLSKYNQKLCNRSLKGKDNLHSKFLTRNFPEHGSHITEALGNERRASKLWPKLNLSWSSNHNVFPKLLPHAKLRCNANYKGISNLGSLKQ